MVATLRQQPWQQSKLGLAAAVGRQKGDSKTAVTATAVAKMWMCGRGCGKTAATAVTTR